VALEHGTDVEEAHDLLPFEDEMRGPFSGDKLAEQAGHRLTVRRSAGRLAQAEAVNMPAIECRESSTHNLFTWACCLRSTVRVTCAG
jgi:hypothetical protein